jgi:hypothetical protein
VKQNTVYNCPGCSTAHKVQLNDATLVICQVCNEIVADNVADSEKPKAAHIPDDWSFLQIGTTGVYKEYNFTVIGRLRLQLRNDYKNFWCTTCDGGKCLWIAESFGSFALFTASWTEVKNDLSQLHAGKKVILANNVTLRGEYVEKCEGISYTGEIGPWNLFYPGFFLIQASNGSGQTAFFTIKKNSRHVLSGQKVTLEELNLKNILTWDEWK